MANRIQRMSAKRASEEIQQWLESGETSSEEDIEAGLESDDDSEVDDAEAENQSSVSDESVFESATDDDEEPSSMLLSKDNSLEWREAPFAAAKGRRSKHNVVRADRKAVTGSQCVDRPIDAVRLYFDDAVFGLLLRYTNEEASRRRLKKPDVDQYYIRDFDMDELKACVGLLMLTGVMCSKRESLDSMWSETFGRPILRATMPLNRYRAFLSCCRFDDKITRVERQLTDKLAAIRELFDIFVSKCNSLYTPSPYVCVDETLVGFRGRCPFKVYIPSKPDRYGIKVWSMCDNGTNYACNMQVYLGKAGTSPEQQQGARVVRDLTLPLNGSGRNITTDNFFTSHALGQFLLEKNLTLLGTVRQNRKELPRKLLPKKRDAYESMFAFTPDTTLVSYAPRTNKTVVLLSTMHNTIAVDEHVESKKPYMVLDYNSTKGAVDSFDQMVKGYTCARGTRRWPMRLFFFIVDASCLNAYVLWSMIHKQWRNRDSSKRRAFLSDAAHELIQPLINRRSCTPNISHMPTVTRSMLAIGVAPVPGTSVSDTNKKRGRCQSCKRSQEQKVEHRCSECTSFVCGKHGIKTVSYKCHACPHKLAAE